MSAIPTVLTQNPFLYNDNDYKCKVDPINGYLKQVTHTVMKTFNLTKEEATVFVKDTIKKHNPKMPIVEYRGRDKNGDKVVKKAPLDTYIHSNLKQGNVLVPSFTVYNNPKVKKSIHNGYVLSNLKKRTLEKGLSKKAIRDGDMEKFSYHDVLQKVRKVFNNSLSGAYASKSTILYNPPAHYTLTTITRAVASIGNAITEMVMMGNRHYTSTDIVLNHLAATVTSMDINNVDNVIKEFNILVPTPEEVLKIIKYSSDLYYFDPKGEERILKYLKALSKGELASVAFVNDLYQLRNFNPKMIREMLTGLGRPYSNNLDETTETLDKAPSWLLDLTHMINKDLIKGEKVDYKKTIGTMKFKLLTGTTERIINTLNHYGKVFRTFFATPVMPIDIVDIKQLTRRAIVVSDTDSTCGSYSDWVKWYFGKQVFTQDATGITGAVMVIVTQSMAHYLKQFSANMNLTKELMGILEMKNEYYWETIVAPLISKHYYAGINIKEGYVFDEPDLEVKGVHFIASNLPPKYKKKTIELYREIIDTVSSGNEVDLERYIIDIADIEKEILKELEAGHVGILKTSKIKPENSYATDWKSSTYYYYKLWDEVFAPKYGVTEKAPISTFSVSTTLTSNGRIKTFIDKIEDNELKSRMVKFFEKHKTKGSMGSYHLPVNIGVQSGVPIEILKVLDTTSIINNLLKPFYMALETCGYHKKTDTTLTQLGY